MTLNFCISYELLSFESPLNFIYENLTSLDSTMTLDSTSNNLYDFEFSACPTNMLLIPLCPNFFLLEFEIL